MTMVHIDDAARGAKFALRILRSLSFASVEEPEKLTFEEAKKRYGAKPISHFIEEMHRRIDQWPTENA